MIGSKSVLALIIARSGSQRLPGKNLRMFNGQPLINWTIEAAHRSQHVDRVLISTDSQEIQQAAQKAGAEAPFLRPTELAGRDVTSDAVVLHTLEWLRDQQAASYDYLVLLQPTSPLRTADDIDQALHRFNQDPKAASLVSVSPLAKNPLWLKKINQQGYLEPLLNANEVNPEQVVMPNGAVYIVRTREFLLQPQLYSATTIPFLMPMERSIDIDQIEEFELAEYYMKQYQISA